MQPDLPVRKPPGPLSGTGNGVIQMTIAPSSQGGSGAGWEVGEKCKPGQAGSSPATGQGVSVLPGRLAVASQYLICRPGPYLALASLLSRYVNRDGMHESSMSRCSTRKLADLSTVSLAGECSSLRTASRPSRRSCLSSAQLKTCVTTLPWTSVRRWWRPWNLNVSRVWSMPRQCSIVACRSWTWTGSRVDVVAEVVGLA